MRELEKVLNESEKVLWEGQPDFWPFFVGRSLPLAVFGAFWMVFMLFFIGAAFLAGGWFGFLVFLTPHFWIGIVFLFGAPLYNYLAFSRTFYAITDKRVIIQKGVIGRDFDSIDLDQITNAEVNVDLFDKLFGDDTGSILISTAGGASLKPFQAASSRVMAPNRLSNIKDPYGVFKFLKQTSHDVKTDISFPNKMRPKVNPGYRTKLAAKPRKRKN